MIGQIYVASRASIPERGAMWRRFRDAGYPINASWIDEDGEGVTADFSDLWFRVIVEARSAVALVLYAEFTDFPLKGAMIEIGAAMASGAEIVACLPGVVLEPRSMRPVGSWLKHPLVHRIDNIDEAMAFAGNVAGYRRPAA